MPLLKMFLGRFYAHFILDVNLIRNKIRSCVVFKNKVKYNKFTKYGAI